MVFSEPGSTYEDRKGRIGRHIVVSTFVGEVGVIRHPIVGGLDAAPIIATVRIGVPVHHLVRR